MPRPGVTFDTRLALMETDRQLVANGITTAYHGLTVSWEPGLRGLDAGRDFIASLLNLMPRLACDTRLHLRHEVYNVESEAEVMQWINRGHVDLLAFNDHLDGIARDLDRPLKAGEYAGRMRRDPEWIRARVAELRQREPEIWASIERLAAAAGARRVPMASHDDASPTHRDAMHRLGVALSEFPIDAATAAHARRLGAHVILGAPNILRGGSHCGRLDAGKSIREGLCTVLTSDYYYPALVQAVFALSGGDKDKVAAAWPLVSENPAQAVGLRDRGRIAPGYRADLVVVDDSSLDYPRVAGTIVHGKIVFLNETPVSAPLGQSEPQAAAWRVASPASAVA
jgi:alpha-D-ribose 1-methylphosphonate 5-triphosphate diphosphatase